METRLRWKYSISGDSPHISKINIFVTKTVDKMQNFDYNAVDCKKVGEGLIKQTMIFFERHISKVIERIKKRKPVLIITGPRQVGKTTILEKLLPDIKYISLDDPVLAVKAKDNPHAFLKENPPPIIIDEIQKQPHLFEYIKLVVDKSKEVGQFFLTGSHSFDLMKGVTESLAGRVGIINMLGLSDRELKKTEYTEPFMPTGVHLEKMRQTAPSFDYLSIIERVHKGSFPELYKTESGLKDWKDFYASYVKSYLEKDIKGLIKEGNIHSFIKFFSAVASLSGEQLNYTTLAELADTSVNTVKNWLSILELSGLVYLLKPYYNNINKRLIKNPKLYFLDTGLICYLSGWSTPEQLVSGARWGHIFESFVFSEILKGYYNDGTISPPLYYYRDKDKNEVDLIIEQAGTIYPIEIKTTTNPTSKMIKGFSALKNIKDKKIGEGALICLYENTVPLFDSVLSIPVHLV